MIDFTRPTAHPGAQIWRKLAWMSLLLYCALLTYLSLTPTVPSAQDVSDKLLHFIAYGGLTTLAAAAMPKLKLISLFLLVSLIGALLEGGQGLLNIGRTASIGDQFANMGGAAIAILIWMGFAGLWELWTGAKK